MQFLQKQGKLQPRAQSRLHNYDFHQKWSYLSLHVSSARCNSQAAVWLGLTFPPSTMNLLSTLARELRWPFLLTNRTVWGGVDTQGGFLERICSKDVFLFTFLLFHREWERVEEVCVPRSPDNDCSLLSALQRELLCSPSSSKVYSAVGVGCHMWLHVRLLQEHTAAAAEGRRPALFSAVQPSTDCSVWVRLSDFPPPTSLPYMLSHSLIASPFFHCSWQNTCIKSWQHNSSPLTGVWLRCSLSCRVMCLCQALKMHVRSPGQMICITTNALSTSTYHAL